jgi:ADP-heptose:LPS heptosyltransferase
VIGSSRRIIAFLVSRADAARDDKRFKEAAVLYGEALSLAPTRAGIHIQRGHMLKEIGQLPAAEAHYLAALRLRPADADLRFQLGHFYKVAGRIDEAKAAYEAAVDIKPNWAEPRDELARLENFGWRGSTADVDGPNPFEFGLDVDPGPRADLWNGRTAAEVARLVPSLAPRRYQEMLHPHEERVNIGRLGRYERTFWGNRRTLRGIEAVRGYCIASNPMLEIQVLLNGVGIYRGPLGKGHILKFETHKELRKKYVFNIWLDFSGFARGSHALELRFFDANEETRSFHDRVVIADPISEDAYPTSNALVSISRDDPRSIEEQVRARPSMVHSAKRSTFPDGVRNILVMRTDQLGDLVASIPALRRLREIFMGANIVGLLTSANADLARTLDLFNEIIIVDFPDDKLERRRLMTLDKQEDLRRQLAPYAFDIALDLAQSNVSRDLLPLAGAKFYYGTGGEHWPWLSADFIFNTHDRWNGMDNTPHSTKVRALVECLGTLVSTQAPIIRRDDLSREMLVPYGITGNRRYALLHAGARIEFSRWPHYPILARMLLEQTDLNIILMTDDQSARTTLPSELIEDKRFRLIDQRLSFDEFDALISFADVMAGNDSGPKHLASLRGTKVVTIFTARINWTEWGQENIGSIISRRVPCAGCAIFHDQDECGKEFVCVTDIKPDEVLQAMMGFIEQSTDAVA